MQVVVFCDLKNAYCNRLLHTLQRKQLETIVYNVRTSTFPSFVKGVPTVLLLPNRVVLSGQEALRFVQDCPDSRKT